MGLTREYFPALRGGENYLNRTQSLVSQNPQLSERIFAAVHLLDPNPTPPIDWTTFKWSSFSPKPTSAQDEKWSCGFFVMLAMKVFIVGNKFDTIDRSQIHEMRREALDTFTSLP
jgi:hypothetical protein